MKRLGAAITVGLVAILFFATIGWGRDVNVRGYYRNDGTYVEPHHRSAPNQNQYDNYSSQGNLNPYTGQEGRERNEYSLDPGYNQRQRNNSGFGR